jgi:hypothetical protein
MRNKKANAQTVNLGLGIKKKRERQQICFRVSTEIVADLDQWAEDHNLTRSAMLRKCVHFCMHPNEALGSEDCKEI